ncbi:hypothetical protein B0T25DRAFT_59670 [Lasiosphaeria hispida]|uniref:Uncharacterized protein n=1 Tax=Lasiosphaeria hispida TaxID=260671 RepID=A0AAJ0ML28_9PEZI|nr:hypothetical protein B0T25DRAFT_59670 [Lasiosphaeria hispida]
MVTPRLPRLPPPPRPIRSHISHGPTVAPSSIGCRHVLVNRRNARDQLGQHFVVQRLTSSSAEPASMISLRPEPTIPNPQAQYDDQISASSEDVGWFSIRSRFRIRVFVVSHPFAICGLVYSMSRYAGAEFEVILSILSCLCLGFSYFTCPLCICPRSIREVSFTNISYR